MTKTVLSWSVLAQYWNVEPLPPVPGYCDSDDHSSGPPGKRASVNTLFAVMRMISVSHVEEYDIDLHFWPPKTPTSTFELWSSALKS